MRKKLAKGFFFLVLALSLISNYFAFRSSKNSKINGGNDANFFVWQNDVTLTVDGCLFWNEEKNRSNEFRQYWKVRATNEKGRSTCTIMDVWDHGSSIIIPDPEGCKLINMDANAKSATITYKDATLTINRDRAIWTTSDPAEKGGGELIRCWDRKINWYPW
jgi:hypothetical protein